MNYEPNYGNNEFKRIKNYEVYMHKAANESKEFVRKNIKGILIQKNGLKNNFIPKVSIITPMYNCQNTIKNTIRSIQNQNLIKIEIILINDFSKDNTLKITKNLKVEDSRIKIINNKKNMGILYTRCIGALSSKGKYIFPLDNDDMFLSEDILNVAYKEAKFNEIDIVTFKGIKVFNINDFFNNINLKEFRNYKNIRVYHQPELGDFSIGKYVIWGKCIKTKLYKKAIQSLGKKRYSQYITFLEDGIIHYILCQKAKSSKQILKYGILKIYRSQSVSHSLKDIKKNKFIIKYIEIAFEFSRNAPIAKEEIANYIIKFLLKKKKSLLINLKDKKIFKCFYSLIKRILNSKYISQQKKTIIKHNIIIKKLKISNFYKEK